MNKQKINKRMIKEVIDELNGLTFRKSEAYSEDSKIFFNNRYYQVLKFLPEIDKKSVCLEIGLAGGVLAFVLKRFFNLNNLYSLEHPIVCNLYKKSFLKKLKQNNILLEEVDLRKKSLPWPNNFFDLIVFSEVMEHLIPADLPNIIKEFHRVLKTNGYLVITTPNISSLLKRINLLFGKNPIEYHLGLHEGATYGHIREYTMSEMKSLVSNQNFKISNCKYFMIDSKRNIFTRIEDLSSKIFPSLANNLLIVVKK